jgi:putative phosphoribosyl transferase
MKREEISIPLPSVVLKGELVLPEKPLGVVTFSHGSGSSRFSPRNMMVGN